MLMDISQVLTPPLFSRSDARWVHFLPTVDSSELRLRVRKVWQPWRPSRRSKSGCSRSFGSCPGFDAADLRRGDTGSDV